MSAHSYWTKERVDDGLRRFFASHQEAPTSAHRYRELLEVSGDKGKQSFERQYPPRAQVLRHYSSLAAAWNSLGLLKNEDMRKHDKRKRSIDAGHLEQLVGSGLKMPEIYNQLGMSDGTFYKCLKENPELRDAAKRADEF